MKNSVRLSVISVLIACACATSYGTAFNNGYGGKSGYVDTAALYMQNQAVPYSQGSADYVGGSYYQQSLPATGYYGYSGNGNKGYTGYGNQANKGYWTMPMQQFSRGYGMPQEYGSKGYGFVHHYPVAVPFHRTGGNSGFGLNSLFSILLLSKLL